MRPRRRRAPQSPSLTRHSAARPRARASPERVPSPPRKKQCVAEEEVCGLCQRADQDPDTFGVTFQQDRLCIHENCLYLVNGLYQHGADDEGFYGFLLPDIEQKLQQVAQKMCCVCRQRGASIRCRRRRCNRTFHFPCGRERGCVSQFYGEYRSFCWQHRPRQRVRPLPQEHPECTVCLEEVEARPTYNTLVCPACTGAQFHRQCIQAQALCAGLHHFRCPLCRNMQTFQAEMYRLGIKIPDRDAAWEEEGAFEDLFQRHSSCDASPCLCPQGREHSEFMGPWRLLLCSSCGSCGTHQLCSAIREDADTWECSGCSGAGTAPSGSAPVQ